MTDMAPIDQSGLTVNPEAEQQVLGTILMNNDALHMVRSFLSAEHFAEPLHQDIFETATTMIDAGSEANPITIKQYLDGSKVVGDISLGLYLARMVGDVVGSYGVRGVAQAVVKAWQRRRLVDAGTKMIEQARFGGVDIEPEAIAVDTGDYLASVINAGADSRKPKQYGDILMNAWKQADERKTDTSQTISWFLPEIDEVVGTIRPGNLVGLMSDSGGGKTSFAVSQCRYTAEQGIPAAFFSIEVTDVEAATQMAAQRLRVSMAEIDGMDLLKGKQDELAAECETGRNIPLMIESFDSANLKEISATIASLKKRIGLKLAIVDHAKMIALPGGSNEMFAERVNGLYRGLKSIAKKHGVAIVILIQRNNDWKGRKNPRPIHSDAYGGGGVKQNLDAFFSLYRPESLYTDMRDIEPDADKKARLTGLIDETRGKAWVINHKRRRGTPNLSRMVRFEPEFTLFSSFAKRDDDTAEELPF